MPDTSSPCPYFELPTVDRLLTAEEIAERRFEDRVGLGPKRAPVGFRAFGSAATGVFGNPRSKPG